MGVFSKTRATIAAKQKIENHLMELFEYRFEVLFDTLEYIKEIWSLTIDYLTSAIQVIVELQAKTVAGGIKNLRTITTFGVFATVVTFILKGEAILKIGYVGITTFIIFFTLAWGIDTLITKLAERKKYKLKFTERAETIK